MEFVHKGRLFFVAVAIDFVDLVGLEVEGVLGEAQCFLEFDGAPVEAALLGYVEFLAGAEVFAEDALPGAEFEYFSVHALIN